MLGCSFLCCVFSTLGTTVVSAGAKAESASRLHDRATAYLEQGQPRMAKPLCQRSGFWMVHGVDHPDVANVLNTLGLIQLSLDEYAEAERHFKRAIQVGSEPSGARIRVELDLNAEVPAAIPMEHGLPGSAEVEVERVAPVLLVIRAAGQFLGTGRRRTPLTRCESRRFGVAVRSVAARSGE